MSGQYITLLSSYDNNIYADNSSSNFRNRLSNEIVFSPNSEIALIECSFIHEFEVNNKDTTFKIFDFLYCDDSDETFGKLTEQTMNNKFINNPLDLCNAMNESIYESVPRLKKEQREIFFFGKNKRIWVKFLPNDYITLILTNHLLVLLGLIDKDKPKQAIIIGRNKKVGTFIDPDGKTQKFSEKYKNQVLNSKCTTIDYFVHKPNLKTIDQFIVLSNLAGLSPVAGHLVNLLRFVTVDPNLAGQRVTVSFGAEPCYVPLASRHINEVQIQLRSLANEFLDLKGTVRILLHIREVK